ncbi:hypothetical protein SCP_1403990 [Sparassis crispa]|uniref:Uncharacterized protein n=1 Tax=Sparassis crispa TaxID=139825 RepID=A0A401H3L0_9APHY|nr:hypothetical protein SCP_1403990 [Sparassis crispa]GBE88991.1 hypothetical protein SCP_1403990 [Sparassis crispa]
MIGAVVSVSPVEPDPDIRNVLDRIERSGGARTLGAQRPLLCGRSSYDSAPTFKCSAFACYELHDVFQV